MWVENVPAEYITDLQLWTSLTELSVNLTSTAANGTAYSLMVYDNNGDVFASGNGVTGQVCDSSSHHCCCC